MIKLWLLEKGRREECSKSDQLEHFVDLVFTIRSKIFFDHIHILHSLSFPKRPRLLNLEFERQSYGLGK